VSGVSLPDTIRLHSLDLIRQAGLTANPTTMDTKRSYHPVVRWTRLRHRPRASAEWRWNSARRGGCALGVILARLIALPTRNQQKSVAQSLPGRNDAILCESQ